MSRLPKNLGSPRSPHAYYAKQIGFSYHLAREEKNLEKIYAPYYDYTKTPALSPDAPDEAVKAYQKQQELFKRKYAEAEALFFSNGDN